MHQIDREQLGAGGIRRHDRRRPPVEQRSEAGLEEAADRILAERVPDGRMEAIADYATPIPLAMATDIFSAVWLARAWEISCPMIWANSASVSFSFSNSPV